MPKETLFVLTIRASGGGAEGVGGCSGAGRWWRRSGLMMMGRATSWAG